MKDKNKRRKNINIRLEKETLEKISAMKKSFKCKTWEEFILVLISIKKVETVVINKDENLEKILNELMQQGKNLNQLATRANEENKLPDDAMIKIKTSYNETMKTRKYINNNYVQGGK